VERRIFTTAVVLIPPSEVQPAIQTIRQDHDRHFKRWMPHITLLYPFRPRHEFDQLAERFATACEAIKPFPIEFTELRCFRHRRDSFTLWLAPEPKDAVVRLQAVLQHVVPDCNDVGKHRDGFTPHLSLGQIQGERQMQALQDNLQAAWQSMTFTARGVSLIWRNEPPDDVFRVSHTVRLGTEAP
jgi:RNA 2',3'-cyclic 3'-phosphodiesterase